MDKRPKGIFWGVVITLAGCAVVVLAGFTANSRPGFWEAMGTGVLMPSLLKAQAPVLEIRQADTNAEDHGLNTPLWSREPDPILPSLAELRNGKMSGDLTEHGVSLVIDDAGKTHEKGDELQPLISGLRPSEPYFLSPGEVLDRDGPGKPASQRLLPVTQGERDVSDANQASQDFAILPQGVLVLREMSPKQSKDAPERHNAQNTFPMGASNVDVRKNPET